MTTKELIDYFAEKELPAGPIKFNNYTTVRIQPSSLQLS
ncbi:DUF6965 family protein [Dyadobacter crusticola]